MHCKYAYACKYVHTISDKSCTREKLCGFCTFLMNHKSYVQCTLHTNALSNDSTFNTDEAKAVKIFPTFG